MTISRDEQKAIIKDFLNPLDPINKVIRQFPYNVMHESDNNKNEHYFVVIEKKDIKSPLVFTYLDAYSKKYSLNKFNLSPATNLFIKTRSDEYYFIFIDSIDHTDPLFNTKDKFIRENANNIISIKMIGEAVDLSSHFENKLDNYLEQVKDVSLSITSIAKDKALEKLIQGKELLDEKAPILKKNIQILGNKLSEKLKNITKNKP